MGQGDMAVLFSIVTEMSESEILAVLDEYFDAEPLTMALFDRFRSGQTQWGERVRQKLLEALIFCGCDAEADYMMSMRER